MDSFCTTDTMPLFLKHFFKLYLSSSKKCLKNVGMAELAAKTTNVHQIDFTEGCENSL